MAKAEIYRAKYPFVTTYNGEVISVAKGDLAHADSDMYKGRKDLFEPAEHVVRFDVEQATAAPAEKRGAREIEIEIIGKAKSEEPPAEEKPKPKAKAKPKPKAR